MADSPLLDRLTRIADALERLAPPPGPAPDPGESHIWAWHPEHDRLVPVRDMPDVPLSVLRGIDRNAGILLGNTRRFALGFPANNALLWGARGMGKSSLVRAVHRAVNAEAPVGLAGISREDIRTLPRLLDLLAQTGRRFLVLCDDLSFGRADPGYRSLKAVLDGGIRTDTGRVLIYATSNRRHLLPREFGENGNDIAVRDTADEHISLSDRFGLWLGFHACSQELFLEMVRGYARHFSLETPEAELVAAAGEWALTRGGRSGRVAWQFIQDLRGREALAKGACDPAGQAAPASRQEPPS